MISYFATDADNNVTHLGTCQKEDYEANILDIPGTVHIGKAPHGRHTYVDGKFIPTIKVVLYTEERKMEYPPIEEFADAMYWNSKGDPSHLQAYYEKCSAVKEKFAKK